LFGLALLCLARYRRQFISLIRSHPGALLGVNGANEIINLGGGLAVRYAMMLAPVALVSAIASTTTLFVFAFGSFLTIVAPRYGREDVSRSSLLRKAVAAVVVSAGVFLAS